MARASASGSGAVGALVAPNAGQRTTSQDPAATQGSTGSTTISQETLKRRVAELEALLTQANIFLPIPGDNPTIPRPRKIINVRAQMGLSADKDKEQYKRILRGMRKIVDQASFDHTLDWRRQPKDKVSRAFTIARKRFPYLCRFENDWVTNHFLRQFCKNCRAHENRLRAAGEESEPEIEMDAS